MAVERVQLVVTKRGRPVAKVVPLDEPASLLGSVTVLAEHEGDWFSTADLIDAPGGLLWATTARMRLPLVTKDRQIHDYARTDSSVEVLW